ncbi:MAG: hypothetical protein WCJ71_08975 [Candidatus Omnitrophota bacterium]
MFRKTIVGVLTLSAFMWGSDAFAGDVDLFTYYPTPQGQYTTLNSTSSSTFATTQGQNLSMGSVTITTTVGPATDSDLFISGTIVQDPWTLVNPHGSAGVGAQFEEVGGFVWVSVGGADNDAAFFRDKNGIVHLKGLVAGGKLRISNIFILPAGYRPSLLEIHPIIASQSGTTYPGMCYIALDGTVWVNVVGAPAGACNWLSLDGITFRADGY